jgi:O-antigen/teichoic acid export membrane protein
MKVDREKVARSTFWSAIENGGLTAVGLVSLVVYSRLLSAADFGLFSIVFALVEMLSLVDGMLFHDALVQRRDVTELHYDTAFTFTVGLSFFLMVACWTLAPAFGWWINQPAVGPILSWMSLCFPGAGVTATIVARQRRAFAFRALALRSLVGRLSGAAAGIAAAVWGAGLWSLVIQQVTTAFIGSIVLWWTCDTQPRFRFGGREFAQLISFGGYALGTLFLTFALRRVYTILAGIFLGPVNAGILNLSSRVVDMVWGIAATAVGQVALPILSALQADPMRLKRVYRLAVTFTCVALYPCFAGLAATAPEVIELVFGRKWLACGPYVTVLALLVLVQAPRLFVASLLTAVGQPNRLLVGLAVQMAFILLAMILLGAPTIPRAIGIWIASDGINIFVSGWILWRATGFTAADQYRGVLVPLAATALMFAALVAARYWLVHDLAPVARLGVLIPIGGVVFCGSLFALDRTLVGNAVGFARAAIGLRRESVPAGIPSE